MINPTELRRYAQQIKLDEIGIQGQEQLQKARVLCIGAGGIGVTLLSYLAAAGVGHIGIVDDDLLEESNLHRQILYREKHIHQAKALIAKKELEALNSTINIEAYDMRCTEAQAQKLIASYDLIADCSDNFYTRYLVHDTCFRLNKPYFYASAYQFQGHCALFYGRHNPCLHCLFPILPQESISCQNGGILGTLPGLLGIIQATELIKWITQSGISLLNRLMCIDFLTMELKTIHLTKNQECLFCIHNQEMKLLDVHAFAVNSKQWPTFLQKHPHLLLLDVRTKQEHLLNNLGGKSIPLTELSPRLKELDPTQETLIYCQSGQRSHQALMILKQAGFHKLYHLTGGIDSI
jgi:adenylyltransferase/sulfurtransferase